MTMTVEELEIVEFIRSALSAWDEMVDFQQISVLKEHRHIPDITLGVGVLDHLAHSWLAVGTYSGHRPSLRAIEEELLRSESLFLNP
ncbi:MAG: hypothetical protein ACFE0I_19490 [Elainellaceae cyanobacterium]